MEEQNFSPEESLQVIQTMIDKTRQQITDNSKFFLLWGWLTIATISGQFFLKVVIRSQKFYYIWLLMFAGIAISLYWGKRDGRKKKVKTYISESMGHLWLGMAICFFVMSMLFTRLGWYYCYPFFILLYGLGTFISGRLLSFPPFVIGGILAWILSIISVQFDFDYQMLFAVAALLVSYIIPAYAFRIKYKKQTV